MDDRLRKIERKAKAGDVKAAIEYWRISGRYREKRSEAKIKDIDLTPGDYRNCGIKFPSRVVPGNLRLIILSKDEVRLESDDWFVNGVGIVMSTFYAYYWTEKEIKDLGPSGKNYVKPGWGFRPKENFWGQPDGLSDTGIHTDRSFFRNDLSDSMKKKNRRIYIKCFKPMCFSIYRWSQNIS